MSTHAEIPSHVPADLVRDFHIDFRGPADELFRRLEALRSEGRALWLRAYGPVPGPHGPAPGIWFFTDAEDIRTALQQPELFSSQLADAGLPAMIPVFLDPPDHTRYRRLLNPLFTPTAVRTLEGRIRTRIVDLIESVRENGSCDFVADVAVQFPTRVFTSWIGLPEEETGRFVAMVQSLIHAADDEADRDTALLDAITIVDQLVRARSAEPTDDLMSQIVKQRFDDRPLTHDELTSIAFLLFLAGLDTVVAALSFSFWHLAQAPDDRRAITDGTVSIDDAVEELLRRHSFLNVPRIVAHDTEFAGISLTEGDAVILSTSLASRDPDEYDDPTAVHLDRAGNRHYAFGLGPHRCLGSHLARLEMRIALDEWHRHIPDYELDGDVGGYGGIVMGVTALPLRWS
jgi:cytochrome P450